MAGSGTWASERRRTRRLFVDWAGTMVMDGVVRPLTIRDVSPGGARVTRVEGIAPGSLGELELHFLRDELRAPVRAEWVAGRAAGVSFVGEGPLAAAVRRLSERPATLLLVGFAAVDEARLVSEALRRGWPAIVARTPLDAVRIMGDRPAAVVVAPEVAGAHGAAVADLVADEWPGDFPVSLPAPGFEAAALHGLLDAMEAGGLPWIRR
jgi:hypothetical protein